MRKDTERTTMGLVPGLLLACLGLGWVYMAIRAMLPDSRNIGAMLGSLAAAAFLLFFARLALRRWWRNRPPKSGPAMRLPVAATVLAPGPGLFVRWLLATPLLLLAVALPVLGNTFLTAWFQHGLTVEAAGLASLMAVPAVVLLVYVVRRTVFATWPKACLWLAIGVAVPTSLLVSLATGDSILPSLALSVGFVWLNYELGRLTLWVLSRPVTRDLALSSLEIPYRPPGTRARLRVQRDRLLLDRLRAEESNPHKEIRWAALRSARLTHVGAATSWQASQHTTVPVPVGPALHIVAENDEWLLPVPAPLGEDLVSVIAMRANVAMNPITPMPGR